MPFTLAQPPKAVTDLTQSKLQEIAAANGFRVQALANAKPEQIQLETGHPVYNLGLQDIVANLSLSQLQVSTWRFIVRSGAGEPSAAETLSSRGSRSAEFSSVNSGPFVAGTTEALAAISKDPTFANGSWEGRLLRVPALYIMAIWAHEGAGKNDRLRPVSPAPNFLNAAKTYTWAEFQEAIRPAAEEKLRADDGGKA